MSSKLYARFACVAALVIVNTACPGSSLEERVDALTQDLSASKSRIASLEKTIKGLRGVSSEQVDSLITDVVILRADFNGHLRDADPQLLDYGTRLSNLDATDGEIARLKEKTAPLRVGVADEKPALFIEAVNVHVRSGSGSTDDGSAPGLGNLIVGYNAQKVEKPRTGSHNLVVGDDHSYSSYGGVVFGDANTISGPSASILGGINGTAEGTWSTICGGVGGKTTGVYAVVLGGINEVAGENALMPLPADAGGWQ